MTDLLMTLWASILPHLLEIVSVVILLLIGRAADTLRARWRIQIEEGHRAALHMALMSGLRAALQRKERDPVASAITHARISTPDAIRALGGTDGALRGIAQGMLATASNPST